LKVLHFWLDSCIANKREKFELEMACWMHLEGFQVVSSHFWALLCTSLTGRGHRSDRSECWLGTGLTGGGDRSDRCELKLLQLPCPGGGAFVQGELACVQGELFVVVRALFWWFALFA
jgi:hypothetical protein